MRIKHLSLYIDLFCCLFIIPLFVCLIPVEMWMQNYRVFLIVLIIYLYILYFAIRWMHFPRLVLQKHYGTIITFTSVVIVITYLISTSPLLIEQPLIDDPLYNHIEEQLRRQTVWLFSAMISGFCLLTDCITELLRQMLAQKVLAAEKDKAELGLYKAQINPHFLFNTLNSLYSLILAKSDLTEQAFVKFADMVHYMYTDAVQETICLRKEITYIQHYIDLQSLRLTDKTRVVFSTDTDNDMVQIPPMLLITFVENAFKYGSSTTQESEIEIHLYYRRGTFQFTTKNTVLYQTTTNETQLGLENCRNRLEMFYPQQFTLETEEKNNEYLLTLTINLLPTT